MLDNTMAVIGLLIFNLTLFSYVLLVLSLGLVVLGRIKAAAGFDPVAFTGLFSKEFRQVAVVSGSLTVLSLLLATYYFFQ